MAANASLLDQLMGAARNALPGEKVKQKHWSDESVCKYYLCGFCPSELFTNTRSDVGPCDKVHDPELKKMYEESKDRNTKGYEERFLSYLEDIINQLDKRIERGYARLKRSASAKAEKIIGNVHDDVRQKINDITTAINEHLTQIEELGAQGMVDEAQSLMTQVEELEKEKNSYSARSGSRVIAGFEAADDFHTKMEVCDVCGSFLVIGDTQSRVDSHLLGKQHLGFARIRSAIVEIKKNREERRKQVREEYLKKREARESEKSKGRESRSSRSSRSRSRSRERHHRTDRRHHRSRSRSRERSKRHRSRSRERKRSKERSSAKERSPHRSHRRHSSHRKSESPEKKKS